jgi:hypothetical protein
MSAQAPGFIDTHGRFDEAGRRAVARYSALKLFPGLAARMNL